ncbi:MAG: M61 family metallopeptidase [Acidobacteria bacterium]|nr:M61 family metallopeptidase [Acidobacteriota bacterium]
MRRTLLFSALALVVSSLGPVAGGWWSSLQPLRPITYRLSFPEPQHHWMQVEATFPDVGLGTLVLRMSRSSPGRYSLHDFAKNVYDVHVTGANGREIETTRPDPYGWNASGHGGSATVKYKVYGDRVDGTYLAVDTTHAHINMPAAIMWAHGLDERPITVTFDQPAGMGGRWLVATQLHGEGFPILNNVPIPPSYTFTAPNLQYLMDSPADFGIIGIRRFSVGQKNFRFALHHTGTDAELTDYAKDVEKIVREEGAIYGEYPNYEPGYYTFIADYLPYASGDGMEHRNSTVISAAASIATGRGRLLDTVAHEFFHCWNVERIRPKGLEPFDFDRANLSGELWLAEGFTQYYGPLALQRTNLVDLTSTLRTIGGLIESVSGPGHLVRSAEEMSRMAPFIDGGRTSDRTNWSTTVISYYPFGGAIALAMDLSLNDRSDSRLSLDDFMRAMWTKFGKPGGVREGYVDRPYTMADAEAALAEVSGDRAFAHEFFSRYIQGHDVADYARLLSRAGFTVRKRNAGRAWLGDMRLESRNGTRVATLVAPTWPVYAAGVDQDDVLQQLDGTRIGGDADVATVLQRHKPGDTIPIVFADRTGVAQTKTITLGEDPHVDVVEAGSLSPAQRAFRDRWLKSRQ